MSWLLKYGGTVTDSGGTRWHKMVRFEITRTNLVTLVLMKWKHLSLELRYQDVCCDEEIPQICFTKGWNYIYICSALTK